MAGCPSTGAWPDVADNVNIDGTLRHARDVNSDNEDGTSPTGYPGCGATVFKLGATEADRPSTPTASGTAGSQSHLPLAIAQ